MKCRWPTAFALACLLVVGPVAAERRDHEAHVHGSAGMDVAALGSDVEISLRSPAMNIVGFEHAPRTEEQRRRFHEAREVLRDGGRLFAFPGASCRLDESQVRRDFGEREDEHDHEEHEDEGGHDDSEHGHTEGGDEPAHSEIHARYGFRCEGRVETIEVALFDAFPDTGEIHVQYLTDDSQGAQTLTPDAPVLRLE